MIGGIYVLDGINPEPWTAGKIGHRGKSSYMYKDSKLTTYQKAVAGQFQEDYPTVKRVEGDFWVMFWFWRSTEAGQPADATNCQKSTEDALQGVLYDNDRHARRVTSEIVDQGPGVEPKIMIEIRPYVPTPIPKVQTPKARRQDMTAEQIRRQRYDPAEDF